MTFLASGLVDGACFLFFFFLLKIHCKGFARHKDVRSDTEMGHKWLSIELKIAQDHWLWPVTVQVCSCHFHPFGLGEYLMTICPFFLETSVCSVNEYLGPQIRAW